MPTYKNLDYIKIMRPLPSYVKRDVYGIPFIEAQDIDISNLNNGKWLINMKNVRGNDSNASRKIVHSFHYDDLLKSAYENPYKFLDKTANYYAVSSFDFSMDIDMDLKQIISAVYDNRWSGAFMQANGRRVVTTVGWLGSDSYDICFAGLNDGATFIISTIGTHNDSSKAIFLNGYFELRKRFPNSKVICVGEKFLEMDEDVCYIPFEESFGNWDRYQEYWQPKLYNWNMSLLDGGEKNVV